MVDFPSFVPQGDAGVLVRLGSGSDPALNARVRALRLSLQAGPIAGVREVLGAYATLLVQIDPTKTDFATVEAWVREGIARLDPSALPPGRVIEVPVVYGGEHGPDLAYVAEHTGLTPAEVIRRHAAGLYLCYVVGFTPGFPYLGGLEEALACPRLDSPRLDLPPGAVGIAGTQTGLYPQGGPGGWQVIGRTPLLFYDPRRDPPALVRAGDSLRFSPVERAEFPDLPQPLNQETGGGRPVLKVLHPGGFSTIQDQGRYGSQDQGVPISGALDQYALIAANLLAGNQPSAAALELTLLGPRLKALAPVRIAVCGADLGLKIDGEPVQPWQALELAQGQVVSFAGPKGGARAMLAVAGGVQAPVFLGSRSTYPLGLLGAPLRRGQVIAAGPEPPAPPNPVAPEGLVPVQGREITVRVLPGPNAEHFAPEALDSFYGRAFAVSERTDRRGMRLSGPALTFKPGGPTSILSEPNCPGVIQVPVGGEPIILLNEQTVGGYAKVACVISADLGLLARALPGDSLRFEAVSLEDAVEAARRQKRNLERLAGAVSA